MKFRVLENLLTEKVFKLRKDVDHLYNKSFKPVVDDIQYALDNVQSPPEKSIAYQKALKSYSQHILYEMSSSKLVTKEAKEAHKILPITLYMCIGGSRGNVYNPGEQAIYVTMDASILSMYMNGQWDRDTILNDAGGQKTVLAELTMMKMKGTINHELSHWIRNAQTEHIDKLFRTAGLPNKDPQKVIKQGEISTLATFYELDAYIHNVMEYKRSLGYKEYNKKTIADLMVDIPAFRAIKASFHKYKKEGQEHFDYYGVDDYLDGDKRWLDWQKKLIKRLDREKMLGKKMRKMDKSL